jgi:hypothetical protein
MPQISTTAGRPGLLEEGASSADLDIDALAGAVARETAGFTSGYLKEDFVGTTLDFDFEGEVAVGPSFTQRVMRPVEDLKRHHSGLEEP